MITNRFKKELNKNEYYVVNPKTGSQKRININKLVDNAKKALKRAVIVGLAMGAIGTGVLSYIHADEIADFKEEKAYDKAVAAVYSEYKSEHPDYKGGENICSLIDSQGCCYIAYPDKLLAFILDGSPIVKRCSDPDCTTCSKNKEIEESVNDILRSDSRFTEIVEEHEHNQEMEQIRSK